MQVKMRNRGEYFREVSWWGSLMKEKKSGDKV